MKWPENELDEWMEWKLSSIASVKRLNVIHGSIRHHLLFRQSVGPKCNLAISTIIIIIPTRRRRRRSNAICTHHKRSSSCLFECGISINSAPTLNLTLITRALARTLLSLSLLLILFRRTRIVIVVNRRLQR